MFNYNFSVSQYLQQGFSISGLVEEISGITQLSNFVGIQLNGDQIGFHFDDSDEDPIKESHLLSLMQNHDINLHLLHEEQKRVKEKINSLRYEKFYTSFDYDGATFDCNESDYQNIKEAIEACNMVTTANIIDSNIPAFTIDWIVADNTLKTMVFSDWLSVLNILSIKKDSIWKNAKTHKEAIDALVTIEAVQAYDYFSGW